MNECFHDGYYDDDGGGDGGCYYSIADDRYMVDGYNHDRCRFMIIGF